MKDFFALVKGVIFVVLSVVFAAGVFVYLQLSYQNPQDNTILFKKGTPVRRMAIELEKNRVIRNRYFFEAYLRFLKKHKEMRSGEYLFENGITLQQAVQKIVDGDVIKYQLTIPEGFNLNQVRDILTVKKKIMDEQTFNELSRRVDFLRDDERSKATTLEGFLFPDTYTYEKTISAEEFIKSMVDNFYKNIRDDRKKMIDAHELSLYELVTLASIVEKETGQASERPLIASVFYNRLQKGMLLQTDPTVIYGIENFDGNLTRKHLETDTPYNTYTRAGLPKGPICSMGIEALDAVLNPLKSDYIFFVGKGDGTHFFSKTLDKHNQAVRYYQLKTGDVPRPE